MSDLSVRRYEPGDADAVWDLHVRALDDAGAYDEAYAHLDVDLRNVREAYLDAGGEFLVGEVAGDAHGASDDASDDTGDEESDGTDGGESDGTGGGESDGTGGGESGATSGGASGGASDGEIVAMGAVQPSAAVEHHETDPDAGVVRRMRVDPGHQRRGYGERILGELERRAADLGFERLVLDTTARQEAAIGLYRTNGYEETRRVDVDAIDAEMLFFERVL